MVQITDIYRKTPGTSAGRTWANYIEDSYGLFVIAGREKTGKTTFLNRIAAEAAETMGLYPDEVVFLRFGDQNDDNVVNPLWVNNPPHQANYGEEEYNRLAEEWIDAVVEEVSDTKAKLIVIDELESSPKAVFSLATALYLRNRIIFTAATVPGSEYVVPTLTELVVKPSSLDRPYWDLRRRKVISPFDYAYCSLTFEQDVEGNRTVEGQTIYGHDHLALPLDLAVK